MTHKFFVDDILLFGKACLSEWKKLKEILELFCSSSGMIINDNKTLFLKNQLDDQLRLDLTELLHYKFKALEEGTVYLGYFIKPNAYRIQDWTWLLKRFDKRIHKWCWRWLSMGVI